MNIMDFEENYSDFVNLGRYELGGYLKQLCMIK